MATKKSAWIIFVILAVSAWIFGSAIYAGAETLNYKVYAWMIKADSVPVGDVEGHTLGYANRGGFYVLENGEVATINQVATLDYIKGAGPWLQYLTIKFEDGSTIILKGKGTMEAGGVTSPINEIIKGTGRFEGIKGTQTGKTKYLPLEPGEAGRRGYGEGTITYTLPPK